MKLQFQERNHEELLIRVNSAENEVAKCRKEIESKEAERIDMYEEWKKLLSMVEEKVGSPIFSTLWIH